MAEYSKELNVKLNKKLQESLSELPEFCSDFFRGISTTTQIKTRIAYAIDLKIYFEYLLNEDPKFKNRKNKYDFKVSDLDLISATDIEKFSEYLSYYSSPHYKNEESLLTHTNSNRGKMRKLATLRSFYKYFYKKEIIKNNPTLLVDLPKINEKPIVRLDVNEVVVLLDDIENGVGLTEQQLRYHEKTKLRDLAIVSLLVGTGIRISECVGINISDIDFENLSFAVTRKGGNRTVLYMPEEVSEAMENYYEKIRKTIDIKDEAFFLSLQNKRMTVSSIQKMLKKYTQIATPLKNISPHKLRSTFGTNLYQETGDIYLVADVLGHKDVNTTKKHYAALEEERRRIAAKSTKLRRD